MSSALVFFVQAVHASSVSHSQFEKHLIMPWISRRHPLCVAIMQPKKNMPFAALLPECCLLRSTSHLTHTALLHVIGSFSKATSEDRRIRDATAQVLIQFRGAYWRYWKNCPPLLFVSNKKMRPNKQQKHPCQSTIPHRTKVEILYSVREINIPNIVWYSCGMR
jgi:hypothetical protein